MPQLIPVDHDPFAPQFTQPNSAPAPDFNGAPPANGEADYLSTIAGDVKPPKLIPVDHDPFASPKLTDTIPQQQIPQMGDALKEAATSDVGKSAISGVPEGLMAATPLGMGANAASFGENAAKFVGQQGFNLAEKIMGDKKSYVFPPSDTVIPNSNDILAGALKPAGIELHEPQTRAGKLAKAVTSAGSFGKATGIPFSGTIPSAVVSEAAGQATEDTPYEVPARIAGQIIGLAGANVIRDKALTPKAAPYTASDIRSQANQAYQKAEQLGGTLKPDFTNKFVSEVEKVKPQTEAGKILAGDSPASQIADRIQNLKDRPLSLAEAQEVDEFLGDTIDGMTEMGRLTKQGKKIHDIQTSFRNMIDEADGSMIEGGKEGFDALKEGRKLWSQQAKLRDVEKIITRAEMTQNPATAMRTGFKNLLTNDSRIRGFNAEERTAISKAANSGILDDVLGVFGSRLGPVIAGATSGPLSGVAAQATAMASRGLRDRVQVGNAEKVADTIAGKKPVPPQASSNTKLLQHIRNLEVQPVGRRLTDRIPRAAN